MKINPGYYGLKDKTIFFEDMTPWDRGEISKIFWKLQEPHGGIEGYEYLVFPNHIVEKLGWGGAEYIYLSVYSKDSGKRYQEFLRAILEKGIVIHVVNYNDRLGKLLQGNLRVRKHNA